MSDSTEMFAYGGRDWRVSGWYPDTDRGGRVERGEIPSWEAMRNALYDIQQWTDAHGPMPHKAVWEVFNTQGYRAFPSGMANRKGGLLMKQGKAPKATYTLSAGAEAYMAYWHQRRGWRRGPDVQRQPGH
jgi:hypothetical protein